MSSRRAEVAAGVEDVDLSGRTALVTGATSGIGRATALALGRLGADVVVHGRGRAAGEAVVADLEAAGADAHLLLADFGALSAVRELTTDVEGVTDDLDILVNNAGGYFGEGSLTDAGVERTFGVNHLAPFLLTLRLLPALRRGDGARVVTVASEAHRDGELPTADGDLDREALGTVADYSGWEAYTRSKLANVLFARELADRLDPAVVTSNACHPGMVLESGFTRNMALPARGMTWLLRRLPDRLSSRLVDDRSEAAATQTYLAAAPEVAEVTGKYFEDCEPIDPAETATDPTLQAALWEASVDMTGVEPSLVPER